MARKLLIYLLIPAVLMAAIGLAYVSYRYSNDLANREREAMMDTLRELAQEKVLNIEGELLQTEQAIVTAVDVENLLESQEGWKAERPAVQSVLVLDDSWNIIPDGFHTRRRAAADIARLRRLFADQVVPDLRELAVAGGRRINLHRTYDGRPYLFTATRRVSAGRTITIVVETDLAYLVGTVFPQYFAVTSPRVYQVVDSFGEIVYGFPTRGALNPRRVEIGFPDTMSDWRLRVSQRDLRSLATEDSTRLFDMTLIAAAVAVIFAGIAVLLSAARRERRANELKSDFISNVSHELKTPLSIISMFGEMLHSGRTKSPEQASEYAAIITRESTRLARLIDNVLDFARIERGADVYEFGEGDLAEVLDRVLDIYRHRFEKDHIELELTVEDGLPRVRMDENSMMLVVLNLIDNAIKYGGEGKRLCIDLRHQRGGVSLRVQDFGPGIAPEDHRRIFERFYRARSVRLQPTRGSGIGLALVKHLVDAHGGQVSVESALGAGTTFAIWIPMGKDEGS
jgi:two-component system, OmpR family, phosphate regulon sensor histidine kinase PhoR